MKIYCKWAAAATSVLLPGFALAQTSGQRPPADSTKTQRLGTVEVRGETVSTSKMTVSAEATASPAAVTLVGRAYIARQAVTSYGDLLRPLAGVSVSNFQLGGVAYGIQMRGYVATEHARDIAFFIDGVPQNQGSNLQANGYADLNPLIPEIIRRIEVVRGPFSAFSGDHALGGTISFDTEDRLPTSLTLEGGTYGTARALGIVGLGKPGSKVAAYVVLDAAHGDGYRDNGRDNHLNGLAKVTAALPHGTATLRVQAYGDNSGSASYLSRAAVEAGTLSRRAAVDLTDGNQTRQQNAVFNYKGNNPNSYFSTTLYVLHHNFPRFRNGGGGQRVDRDERTYGGGDVRYTRITTLGGAPTLLAAGVSYRADAASDSRFPTVGRVRGPQTRQRDLTLNTPSAYAQVQYQPLVRLKLTAAARYDRLYYDVRVGSFDVASVANTTTTTNVGAFNPKVGAAFSITPVVSLFANYARGFKGIDGYGDLPGNASLGLSRLNSYEAGFSADDATGRLHGLLTAYHSEQTGEVQVDPLGNLTNFGHTRRQGVEVEGRYRLAETSAGPTVFGNYSYVQPKLLNEAPDDGYVTNTPRYLATVGLDLPLLARSAGVSRLALSLYDQLIGPKYLDQAGTMQTSAYQRLAGKLLYTRTSWAGFRLYVQGTFYPGTGALDEMTFLSGGSLLTAPQPKGTFTAGLKIPISGFNSTQ
ncbi:TonB-dependent receptor [Hymenobacter sp. H14-R3]|uniref:TonB-dependent receptor n=1 Tax=Hymenobacter sp. H14-R3 TaxID=3046308 RepID=UPI0024BB4D55|nr:TonB-dependent receptor [Hymenobacter sp. H14-R3]MDJ0364134.1 TonB-dependent receptor [Hymenobacter sp. H14-R3]